MGILGFLVLAAFYLVIRFAGGTGVRTQGRTLVDKPDEEAPPEE
jgi:hypothetical protein